MEEFLPVGSVVRLKGGTRKTIIMGYLQFDEKEREKVYDYMGVPFPTGYMGMGSVFLFDEDSIEEVYFRGYEDASTAQLLSAVSQMLETAEQVIQEENR